MDSLPSIHKKPSFAAELSRAEWLIRSLGGRWERGRVAKTVEMTMLIKLFVDKRTDARGIGKATRSAAGHPIFRVGAPPDMERTRQIILGSYYFAKRERTLPRGNKPLLSRRVSPSRSRTFVAFLWRGSRRAMPAGGGAGAPLLPTYRLLSVCFVCECN